MITPIRKIMTEKILTVLSGTSLLDANQIMTENRVRHLPVVDEMKNVLGILSQKDFRYVPEFKNLTVDMLMTKPVASVESDTSLRQTIFLMLENKISSVLVTDEDNKMIGIVTTDDILWHLAHLLRSEKASGAMLPDVQTIGIVANQIANTGI